MTTPINFITAPAFAYTYQNDISISVAIKAAIIDYPRLIDPVIKLLQRCWSLNMITFSLSNLKIFE